MAIHDAWYDDDEYVARSGGTREYGPRRYMLTHSRGVEYSRRLNGLDFSVIDPFSVWSVFVDFGYHQTCIAQILPLSVTSPDTSYVVGAGQQIVSYVDGAAFVPGVIRAQLAALVGYGEYDVYGRLSCVTVKPAEALTSSDAGTVPA